MGYFGSGGLSCFLGTWCQLLSCSGWLRQVGTSSAKTGLVQESDEQLFRIRGSKMIPSDYAKQLHF